MLAGPALCVAIKGISSLPAERLGQLLSSSGRGGPSSLTPGQPASNHASGVAALQQGLGSAWAVTDVLQVCASADAAQLTSTTAATLDLPACNSWALCCGHDSGFFHVAIRQTLMAGPAQ